MLQILLSSKNRLCPEGHPQNKESQFPEASFHSRTPPNKLLTPLTAYKAFITMQNDAKKGVKGWSGCQGWTPRPAGWGGAPLRPTL